MNAINDIVSVNWLNQNLNDTNLIILDASLATTVQGDASEYQDKVIPGSRYFDLKGKFSDKNNAFPNAYPTKEQIEKGCRELGINNESKIVVYDNRGIYSSPRVWWLFKSVGHDNVAVLDGGLPEWIKMGFETEPKEERSYEPGKFKVETSQDWVRSYEEIVDNVETGSFQIVDARSKGRFDGVDPEPRTHLQSGRIPNSVNIPFKELMNGTKFKSIEELKDIFEQKVADDKEMVFSCGSGLTACIVMLASEIAYKKGKQLFDGSWTEWAERQELFVED